MSLVHEALQKAEREKQRKAGAPPMKIAVTTSPKTADAATTVPTPTWRTAGWIVLASVCVVVAGIVVVMLHKQESPQPSPPPVAAEKTAPALALPENSPPPPVGLSLTGIMKDPGGQYCAVLNGRVVYESHVVDGATVKSIERDRVTLDVNGKETVVRLF